MSKPPTREQCFKSAPPKRPAKIGRKEKVLIDAKAKKDFAEAEELKTQTTLFELDEDWRKEWKGMPEFKHDDLTPFDSLVVHFKREQDRKSFSELIGQTITELTKSLWYPKAEIGRIANKRWKSEGSVIPRYPIYIISKGRWETRLTQKSLEEMGVPYHIVVEPQEFEKYAKFIDRNKILALPFSNLGQGSIPARNWCWEHAIKSGADRHWIMDDNINGFYRFQDNLKVKSESGAIFCAMEDFCDRYENVAIAGPQYFMFVSRKEGSITPYQMNTRIYSCILIDNSLPYRWRGRYNEDTDLSVRALKDGLCTIQFNAFLQMKSTTMTMRGGNTESLYEIENGRMLMAQSLKEQHPDIVTITRKWGRWQHQVNYAPFKKNKLILKKGIVIPEGENNYGMELQTYEET